MKTSVLRLEKFWLGMKSILKSQRKIKLNFSKWKSILNSFQVLYKRKFQKRQSCSRIIQSLWRGFQARRQYVTIRNSVLFMQNKRRSQLQRRYYLKLMKSVIVIQNQFRKKLQKVLFYFVLKISAISISFSNLESRNSEKEKNT